MKDWIYKQMTYKNRALTPNLQPPAQETPLLSINSPGSQPALSQICRKLDSFLECQTRRLHNNFSNNQPQMARTWLIMDSFLNFCPTFTLGSIKENHICTPNQSWRRFQFWWACPQHPHANSVQSGCTWNLPSFPTIKMKIFYLIRPKQYLKEFSKMPGFWQSWTHGHFIFLYVLKSLMIWKRNSNGNSSNYEEKMLLVQQ